MYLRWLSQWNHGCQAYLSLNGLLWGFHDFFNFSFCVGNKFVGHIVQRMQISYTQMNSAMGNGREFENKIVVKAVISSDSLFLV